jgi:peroxiredoxin
LAEWERNLKELKALGAEVYAVSVDGVDEANIVATIAPHLNIAYGASKSQSDSIGAWWNHDGSYIEPTEFILGRGGIILGSIYASGPIGRMNPTDVIQLIKAREQKGLSRPGKNVSK